VPGHAGGGARTVLTASAGYIGERLRLVARDLPGIPAACGGHAADRETASLDKIACRHVCIIMQGRLHVQNFLADTSACKMRPVPRKYSMQTRSEEAALRRQRLIDAAVEVLGEVGADRLTMDMVAQRADAATRTVYNHFPSRQELLAAVQAHLLQAFRDTLQLDIPATGEPAERLRQFVALLYDMYERQGAALTTMLELDEPAIRAQVRDMRAWRRDRLEQILRPADGALRLPLAQAAGLAFVLTNHITWRALREEMGLTQDKAIQTTATGLETGLFGASPSRTKGTSDRAQSR
jgi:AcrR family transcriptional regulator